MGRVSFQKVSPALHFLECQSSDAGEKLCSLHHLLPSVQSILLLRWNAAQIRYEIHGAVAASGVKLNVNKRKESVGCLHKMSTVINVNVKEAASFTFTTIFLSFGGGATCTLIFATNRNLIVS